MNNRLEKRAISQLILRANRLLKARGKARPLRMSTLLAKLGGTQPTAPSPLKGTRGAGNLTAPSGRGFGGVGKLTPPPPVGGMQLQRNLFAAGQKPGQFKGFTTHSQMNPTGASAGDLNLPPVVPPPAGLPPVTAAFHRVGVKLAAPQPATPNPVSGPTPPAPDATPQPVPAPNTSWWDKAQTVGDQALGGASNPVGVAAPAPPPEPTPVSSPDSRVPLNLGGLTRLPSGAEVWTPPVDYQASQPYGDLSWWDRTKMTGAQALGGALNPFDTGLKGLAATLPLSATPIGAPLTAGLMLGGAAWAPIKSYIDRAYGGTQAGEVRSDMPDLGQFQHETGIHSKAQFIERYGNNLDAVMSDPVLRSVGMYYGVIPGGGTSISQDIDKGEWIPREGGGGEWSGEAQAWMNAAQEKAMQNPMNPLLAALSKQGSLKSRNSEVVSKIRKKKNRTPSPFVNTIRAMQRLRKSGAFERAEIASRQDREAVTGILKRGQWWKAILPVGAGVLGLGAYAITPSEQQAPGMSPLARFGLGLTGLYAGAKYSDKIGLPSWLGGLLGAGIVPGVVGSFTSGGQGGLLGATGPGIGGLAQSPLVTGALGYLLADKTQLGRALPGGKWGGAALGALVGPALAQGLTNTGGAYPGGAYPGYY